MFVRLDRSIFAKFGSPVFLRAGGSRLSTRTFTLTIWRAVASNCRLGSRASNQVTITSTREKDGRADSRLSVRGKVELSASGKGISAV